MSGDSTQTAEDGAPAKPPGRGWVRALLIGLLLIPPSTLFGVQAYIVVQALLWTSTSLLRGPVLVLFVLVLINLAARRLKRRLPLSGPELLLIYVMLAVATAVGGVALVQYMVPMLGSAFYYATPENRWAEFHPYIPRWFVPGPAAIDGFFKGHSSLYRVEHLRAWATPFFVWIAFLGLLMWVMLCLTVLVRRRWSDEERLTFPLITLPVEMARDGGPREFWASRWMWIGFVLAGALESVNFVNWFLPTVPYLPIKARNVGQYIIDPPWNALNPLYLTFYPFMIGIGYILTLDISLSCWALYLIAKLENVVAVVAGLREPGASLAMARAPYINEQGAGAFVGLALLVLWSGRGALRQAWEAAKQGKPAGDEMLAPRTAFLGLGFGFLALVGFCWVAGLNPLLAGVSLLLMLLFTITVARIVAEAGAGWVIQPWMSVRHLVGAAVGLDGLGARNLTVWTYVMEQDMDYRDSPMAHQLQGARIGAAVGIAPRQLAIALLLAGVVGAASSFWAHLHVYYIHGCATAKVRPWITTAGQIPFQQLRTWLSSPPGTDLTGLAAAGCGFGILTLVAAAHRYWAWWPFHPVGYALANTTSLDYVWCPFLIAWVLKWLTLRVGGIALYRRALPFFLGLILGDFVVPGVWGLIGTATNTQMYLAYPH